MACGASILGVLITLIGLVGIVVTALSEENGLDSARCVL